MQFLKRHFEKIILSAVLAGLGAAAFWLFAAVREAKSPTTFGTPPPAKPWVAVDLTALRNALKGLKDVPEFSLSDDHNLFNPVTWKMSHDGRLFKMNREGPMALTVTEIVPLYYTIRLDKQAGEAFQMVAKHPMGPEVRWFGAYNDKGPKNKPYPCVIVGTNAAQETPAKLQVLIPETGQTNLVTATEPYQRVELYEASMKYNASDSTNVFNKKHVNDTLQLSQEEWKIIAITSNTVTVQNTRTAQKSQREWNGGP